MSVFSYGSALTASVKHSINTPTRNLIKTKIISNIRTAHINSCERQNVQISLENLISHSKKRNDYDDLLALLRETQLEDNHLLEILKETRHCMELLRSPRTQVFVETLININWLERSKVVINEYQLFLLDLLVAQINYSKATISMLISHFTREFDPTQKSSINYINLTNIHNSLDKILEIIPATFKMVSQEIYNMFPYHNQPPAVFAAYLSNSFWLLQYRPIFTEDIINMLIKQLVTLDTRLPREELEQDEDAEISVSQCEMLFDMDEDDESQPSQALAETLDRCMGMIFEYLTMHFRSHHDSRMFETLFNVFVDSILLTYNSHHVQFIMFYYCSLKNEYSEMFIQRLWRKTCDFNETPLIRQAAVDYVSSFLARSKFLPISTLQHMIQELCQFAHNYINRCDSMKNKSLKGHTVFFAICQAIFYLIAFRSKDLFSSKKNILFLQSLQLSLLVNSRLNPLLVCKPAVVQAFASVTRVYQLAYCYTIMERNSRRKLATIYSDVTQMPEECLKTMFPFDPYLLKKSSQYIDNIYQSYESGNVEEEEEQPVEKKTVEWRGHEAGAMSSGMGMSVEDGDDFLMNRHKSVMDSKFSYGSSPGFH